MLWNRMATWGGRGRGGLSAGCSQLRLDRRANRAPGQHERTQAGRRLPLPFLGLAARWYLAHSEKPSFTPPGAGMLGKTVSPPSSVSSRYMSTVA
jgi:hypothetical protein